MTRIAHRLYNPLSSQSVSPSMWYMIAHTIRNTSDSLEAVCQDYDFAYTEDMFPFILQKLEEYGAFFCPSCKMWRDSRTKNINTGQCFMCYLNMK